MTNFHLVLVALTTIVGATIAPASAVEPAGQMVFYDANNGGNCSSCAWIAATGEITEGTAERFERFVQQRNDKMCRLVVMHSPGGLLTEGIRLGYALRKHGCTTTIGRTVSAQIKEAPHLKDVEPGHCYSACAYAFLGGERRWVDATSRYGVHQHFNADAVVAPLAKTLSSLDLSTSQFLTGLLVAYVIEMDVNPLLVTVAAMAAPHEDIAVLDRNALEAMRVVTDITPPMAEWSLVPIANGLVAQVEQIQDDSGSIQRARLLCTSGQPNKRFLEIIVPVGQFAGQIDHELKLGRGAVVLRSDTTLEINNYSAEIVGQEKKSLMILRLALSDDALEQLVKEKKFSWARDASRVSQKFFSGWFSLKKAGTMSPFAFKHCI
ncbi:hypothetical protein [Aromatoleum anaerobium]|uniref:Periplasmic protein n=1 Tax=Aromatoleum anaerobium TaxID=182180 RepID=A0ABX1PPY8_9RHOO|nr:hypothetical protein [Aromatoleum anaerobium]MCK0506517.1 hypothetical protein [Aromatoleum anaerobium]